MKKRGAKGFFEVEWKKFIFPILLIILFGYLVYVYFSIANITDKTSCYMVGQQSLMDKYYNQNNEELLEKTIYETELTLSQINSKFDVEIVDGVPFQLIISPISKIYPFFPTSCEVEPNLNKQCRYYSSKESYDCMLEFISSSVEDPQILSIFYVSIPEYKKVSTFMLILHFILIFIWGYLISAILLFLFRFLKRKLSKK